MMKQVQQDGLTYLINKEEKKAKIDGYYEDRTNFLILRSIKYESQEYIIQSISKNAFQFSQNIKSIEFSSDSELQTIEEGAFSYSFIESIFIPASVIDIKEGWCSFALKLTTVKVDPRNPRYNNYEDKMIIYKRTETNENYDEIVFCQRDIKEITIPSFIKIIGSYSFEHCEQLQRLDIPSNSELQTIEEGAFSSSSIESIFIPASLIDLKKGWCKDANKLTTVKIDPRNPRYSYIDNKMIICKRTETNENYDEIVFCRRDIEEITIPSFIKIIGPYSFYCCKQLQRLDIPSNSELQTIEARAFSDSSISSIFIPPHVTKICEDAFYSCNQLQRLDIPPNSELQTIEEGAFSFSFIESIFIPASVIDLKEGWCKDTNKLKAVKIDPRNPRYKNYEDEMIICKRTETNENYDEIVFCRRDIKEITIPSFIKIIGPYSFYRCKKLQKIDIPSNSELQTIEKWALAVSSISSIFIPPHVTKICEYAFSNCYQLQRVDIPSNSELQTIEEWAFTTSSISSIFIPAHVTKICENAFSDCFKLHLIEIDEKSEIELYDISSIFPSDTIIMIPVK